VTDLTTLATVKQWLGIADKAITGISKANPAIVTCANHNQVTGKQVVISGVGGMTQVHGTYTITKLSDATFSIGVDSSLFTTYASGGFVGVDDVMLARLITAITGWIIAESGRSLASDDYTETYNGLGSRRMSLRNFPVTDVTSLQVDGITIPQAPGPGQAGYFFDRYSLYLNGYAFSKDVQNVIVTYTGGAEAGDWELVMAEQVCLELLSLAYRGKEFIGQRTKALAGESVSINFSDVPASTQQKLNKLKRVTPI
jgi:hypothetical protein